MAKSIKVIILVLGVFLLKGQCLFAQVTIIPPNLFIPENAHFASLQIKNASPQPQEVSVKFKFGYPVTDSLGNMQMDYNNTVLAQKFSAARWLHAFPRSFTLRPNASQVVRILVRAPQDLKTGLYWTRVQIVSTPQAPPVGQQNKNGVSTRISFSFNQVTSAFLEVGNPTTNINIESFNYRKTKAGLEAFIKARRTGNAPFLGTVKLDLYKQGDSKPVKSTYILTSVYFEQTLQLRMEDLSGITPGNYIARVTFTAQRNDIDTKNLPTMTPVTKKFNVTIK